MTVSFHDRYAIRLLADGAIAVDLSTGDFLRLNRTAAMICAELLSCADTVEVANRVATHFALAPEQALVAVNSTMEALGRPAPRRTPPGAFLYEPASDGAGYQLSFEGVPRVGIDADGRRIRILSTDGLREAQLYEYVRAIAPKILFLRGSAVLHGAACVMNRRLLAICGESGAGKTTTVRAFVAAGARPVSEDLLVLAAEETPGSIYLDGERSVHGWARAAAKRLFAAPEEAVATDDLQSSLRGGVVRIDAIWTIAADRRSAADAIVPRRLAATDATAATLGCLFLGAASPEGWRRFLEVISAVATTVPVFDAPMPHGIDRLKAAVSVYIENSAS